MPGNPLPAIACAKDGSFFILGKVAVDKALIQSPGDQGSRTLSRDDFLALWSGELILMTTRAHMAGAARA